jgi:hypothetical protein
MAVQTYLPARPGRSRPALWCVDSLGSYLRLREGAVASIRDAVTALCPGRAPTADEFDVIADGLWLVMLELEDEANLERFDLEAVEAALADRAHQSVHRVTVGAGGSQPPVVQRSAVSTAPRMWFRDEQRRKAR